MTKQVVEVMIEGGKATAAPPLGPALGPTGLNIGQVITEINQKTADMKGMQVPVKILFDSSDKSFTVEIGTPPVAALIKKEAGVEKGAGNPKLEKVANLMLEQVLKIAKIKESSLGGSTLKNKIKEVVGTCVSMGILVEGIPAKEALAAINEGKFDAKINAGRTELTAEERAHLEIEKKRLKEEMEKKRAEYEARAKAIVKEMEGKEARKIRGKMMEEGIPKSIIDELVPEEKPAAGAPSGKK
ncbi:50S ribosomal protein L11 [Candidatus Woesearchaeota archaeon]|nr:50S ribosomal protein L11 [Candidatus Woesearchaeota archaeon]